MSKIELIELKDGGKFPFPVKDIQLRKDQVLTDNEQVRRPKIKVETYDYHELEYLKCQIDPIYFIQNYTRIISLDEGLIPFRIRPYQIDMVKLFVNSRYSCVNAARQIGKSTIVAAFILWFILFQDDKNCAILANKSDQALEIMDRIRLMYTELPFFLQKGAVKFNLGEIVLENRSKVFSGSSNPDTVRGKTLSLVYWDEAAHTARDEEFWTSTFPVLSSGKKTKVILTSTPKGARGVFYKICKGATDEDVNKRNGFNFLEVTWDKVAGRDQSWKDATIAKTSPSQFQQEHEVKFLGSSGSLIPTNVLENLFWENPIKEEGELSVYQMPDKKRKYIAVADCAEGLGQDYSICTIFDVTELPYKIAAVYRSNIVSPLLFPYQIVSMCNRYNECPVLIESNNDVGGQVCYIMHYELEYPFVIRTKVDEKGLGLRIGGVGSKPGVKTTKKVKMIGCSNLKTLIENGLIQLSSQILIEELGTFIAVGNSFEADEGCNDDVVMTAVLFSWLVKQPWFKDLTETDVSNGLGSGIGSINDSVLNFFGPSDIPDPMVNGRYGEMTYVDGIESGISFKEWINS